MEKDILLLVQDPIDIEERKITWNKDELVKFVKSVTEKYKGLIFDDTQIKEAKDERAKLNGLKKTISKKRIDVKNDFMKPYLDFEKEINEVVELINVPINSIDCQIKTYEKKQKEDKKNEIFKIFSKNINDLSDYVQFNDVFELKYLNVSMKYKKIEKEILNKLNNVKKEIELIKNTVGSEYIKFALEIYKEKKNLSVVIAEINRLKIIEKERKKQAENNDDNKNSNEVIKDAVENNETKIEKTNKETKKQENLDKVVDPFTKKETQKIYRSKFTCYGTKDKLIKLKQFMIDEGIRFE